MYLRSRNRLLSTLGIAGIATALLGTSALAQNLIPGPPPKALQKNPNLVGSTLDFPSGDFQDIDIASPRSINMSAKPKVVWEDVLRVNNVAWLRLYFSEVHLEGDSFIRVTSLLDGQVQELDASTMNMWSNSTAYFNGNAVKIELVGAPWTLDNQIRINQYAYEIGVADRGGCGICGNDDRVPSSDNNFARLMPVGCSATLYNEDSCMVTAGHCLGSGGVVQFNVPASNSDGSTNNPGVNDQFPVQAEQGVNSGVGADYGALFIGTNGNGDKPYDAYGSFMPLASSVPGSGNIDIRGYGVDENDPTRSQTQQYHSGPINNTDASAIYYDVDVTFGNSGSSIIANGEIIGVVTHCSTNCENYGTRIDLAGFVQVRGIVCNGDDPPGGCPVGEIEDCNGNCCPANWVGDGYCDDGSYQHNSVDIYLNCDTFDCDGGDCPPESCDNGGGDPTGACCVGNNCSVVTAAECGTAGGDYLGDGSSCAGEPCGGGGGDDGDNCGNAVDASVGANPFDTSSATDSGYGEPDDSQCSGTYLDWQGSADFWMRWSAPGTGTANFSTCDASSYDTSLVLYQGSDCNNLNQVACNGDSAGGDGNCQSFYSEISYEVVGGQTYFIRIGGWQGATGAGTLTIDGEFGGDPLGACCVDDNCSVVTAADCSAAGGNYLGDDSNCDNDPCGGGGDPTGACCITNSCSILTADECNDFSGSYLGDNTSCAGDPCGGGGDGGEAYLDIAGIDSWDLSGSANNEVRTVTIPAGASITGVGWENVTLSAYDPSWGSEAAIMFYWENDGEPFAGYISIFPDDEAPGDYGPADGFDDLSLDYNFTDADGQVQVEFFETYDDAEGVVDSTWTGGSIYIVYNGGGGGDPTGACCVNFSCSIQTQLGCVEQGGDYLGDGTNCSDNPCAGVGACCIGSECLEVTSDQCSSNGGDFYGDGTTCANITCEDPPAVGACCVDNSCFSATADDCGNADGSYQGDNTNCADVDCGGGNVTGACCYDNSCAVTTIVACITIDGEYQGDDTDCSDDPCGLNGGDITVMHSIIGKDLLSIDEPNWTVDLFVTMSANQRLDAVAGTPDQQKMLTCSTSFFQNGNGGPTSVEINPAFYEFDPDLEWDSRVSIGCIDSTGNPFPANNLQNIGIDWTNFENGGDLSVGNGLWFHLPDDVAGEARMFVAQDCSMQYGVHLGRLTVLGDDGEIGFEGIVQGRDTEGNVYSESVSTYFGYTTTEDCNGNLVPDTCDIANGTSEDANGNGIPDECDDSCPGDADGDGDADVDDVLNLLSAFGSTNGDGDLTGDGVCNVDDILLLLSYFGDC
ncbi:MAG: hypothetical protein P8M22_04330 [Phycisphaerales bacterium]|nr:hypothetical protein [Phycisphaerales bacterium]